MTRKILLATMMILLILPISVYSKKNTCKKHDYVVETIYTPLGCGSHQITQKKECKKCGKTDNNFKEEWYPFMKTDSCKGEIVSMTDRFITRQCSICREEWTNINEAKVTVFSDPSAFEGEHITIEGTLDKDPRKSDDTYFANVKTKDGDIACIVLPDGENRYKKGDKIKITGEIAGASSEKKGKRLPIVDDVTVINY